MLDLSINILLGKMLGLINGLYSESNIDKIEEDIKNALKLIKEGSNLDDTINKFIDLKAIYLKNCLTCQAPCGRTFDFYLNDIKNIDYRNLKIEEFNNILNSYETINYKTLIDKLISLTF